MVGHSHKFCVSIVSTHLAVSTYCRSKVSSYVWVHISLYVACKSLFCNKKDQSIGVKVPCRHQLSPFMFNGFCRQKKKITKKQQKFQRFYFSFFLYNICYKTLNKFVLSTFCFLKVFFLCTTMLIDIFFFFIILF